MICVPRPLLVWSLSVSISALPHVAASASNAFPTGAGTLSTASTPVIIRESTGAPPIDPIFQLQQDIPVVTEQPMTSTLSPRQQRLQLRRRHDVDRDTTRPTEPPTLWLDSLDSLRCTKYSTATPGDSVCEGRDAWSRAGDGSKGVFFVAIGDTGQVSDGLLRVSDRLAGVCSSLPVSFISLLGDNFYPSGVGDVYDEKFHSHFEIPFQHASLKRVAFFPIFGNHDYKSYPQAQIHRYYALCKNCKQPQDWNSAKVRWRFPNPWYFSRLVYTNVPLDLSASPAVTNTRQMQRRQYMPREPRGDNSMIVVNVHLDSNLLLNSPIYAMKQMEFLEKVLQAAAAEADWVFVHQHHPLFTDATLRRNDKAFQDLLLPLFLRYGVDAVFAGHEHLLSQFELNLPGNETGPIVQIISGAGSKLHHGDPRCCNPGYANSCGSHAVPCPSKNCLFQENSHGFVLVELSLKQMRFRFIDAATGEVVRQSTYSSKKATRLLKAAARFPATGEGTAPGFEVASASAYPPIDHILVPKELTGGWLSRSVRNSWIPMMIVAVTALLCILCYRRCMALHKFISERSFRPNWARWRRTRQSSFELVEPATVIGAQRPAAVPEGTEVNAPGTNVPIATVVVDSTGLCELRKQRAEDGLSLV